MSPTVTGLQSVYICLNFGTQCNIWFNEKKTQCIQFRYNQCTINKNMYIGGENFLWFQKVKYLGNWLNTQLDDSGYLLYKKGVYVQQINKLVCNFFFVNKSILYDLYNTCCTSLYCCQSLDLARLSTSSLQTVWNKFIRGIWNLPLNTHTNYLPFMCID